MLAAIVHNPNPRFVLSFKWGDSMVDLNVDLMFKSGASLVVQWLRLCTSTTRDTGSILVGELRTNILHTAQ